MTSDKAKGYIAGKRLKDTSHPYHIVIDGFKGDRDEFVKGLRLAGFGAKVSFADN